MMATTKPKPQPTFTEYLTDAGTLPADALLGKLVLFTITDEPVAHSDLVQWFTELQLDPAMLPGQIRELDAFKKATSDARGSYPMSREREAFTLCRDVTASSELVKRQITREIKDSRSKTLSYEAAIDCTFYKKSGPGGHGRVRLHVRPGKVEAEEMKPLEQLTEQIAESYDRYANFHDGQKLRGMVRSYLKHLNGLEVKGGVYFVYSARDDELQRLRELVNRLGGGCLLHTIPMVDLEQDREFIASVFEREASQKLEEITRDTRDLMNQRRTITDGAYLSMKARFDQVLTDANEHMVNLQVTQDVTAAAAEIALKQLQALQVQVATAS